MRFLTAGTFLFQDGKEKAMKIRPLIYIIDDDVAVRDSLALLLTAQGFSVKACESAEEFWDFFEFGQVGCILLDLRMPQMDGLELQAKLCAEEVDLPIIFITGHGDVNHCRQAFQNGAVDFLTKPIDQHTLLPTIRRAIEKHIRQSAKNQCQQATEAKLSRVTARERDVLGFLVLGYSSKQIAQALNLSPRTIETYRANLFEKLEIDSLADLIKLYLQTLTDDEQNRFIHGEIQ